MAMSVKKVVGGHCVIEIMAMPHGMIVYRTQYASSQAPIHSAVYVPVPRDDWDKTAQWLEKEGFE